MAEETKRIGATAVAWAPWKSDAYWDREQSKLGQRVNDVLDGMENLRARVRGALSFQFGSDS